jgi:predicted exporter
MTPPAPRKRLALVLWIICLIAAGLIISRSRFTADISAFLPRSPSPTQKLLVEQLRDGVVSRLILIGIEGAPQDQLAQLSKALAAHLGGDPRFASVQNGDDSKEGKDRELLWTHRYLLSPAVVPGHFESTALHAALDNDLELLASPAGALAKRVLADDPTQELLRLVEHLSSTPQPIKHQGVWFAPSGARALLVVETRAAGFDLDSQEQAQSALLAAFAKAQSELGAERARLLASGPGVISVETRARIKRDASRLSLLATSLVAILLLIVYRSIPVLVLALLPVASGALAGIAAVSLGFGSVHGITLGFGATLIGEAVDYAIYLFTQTIPGTSPDLTLPRIWPTLRLGVLTSICGFSALLFSSFTGLAQLGLFSIAGLIAAVAVTRFVLPRLMPRSFTAAGSHLLKPLVGLLDARTVRWRVGLTLAVALALVMLLVRDGPIWDDRLSSLSPTAQNIQDTDAALRSDIAAPDAGSLLVIHNASEEGALEAAEALSGPLRGLIHDGALEGYDSPADVLPSQRSQRARQAALPSTEVLRANLQSALTGEPFRSDLFEPFLADVEKARGEPLLDRRSFEGTGLGLKLDSLLIHDEGAWIAMLPLHGVRDSVALRDALPDGASTGAVLLNLKSEADQLYETYLREAQLLSALGCGVIVLLLAASLRNLRRCLQVTAPLAAAVIITSAVLVAAGERLTIFHLVGLLLVVAVGSNYALFFERQEFTHDRQERTVASLALANICTVIGFGTLSFSVIPVLHGIGVTVALGAVLCLLFSALCVASEPAGA